MLHAALVHRSLLAAPAAFLLSSLSTLFPGVSPYPSHSAFQSAHRVPLTPVPPTFHESWPLAN